jgi:hypothetical protein
MFISQDLSAAQMALLSMSQADISHKFILPIDGETLMRQLGVKESGLGGAATSKEEGDGGSAVKVDEKVVVVE